MTWSRGVTTLVESAILLTSVAYVVLGQLWTLLLWESITLAYLIGVLVVAWNGQRDQEAPAVIREVARWSWLLPLAASVTGGYSAVVALVTQAHGGTPLPIAVAASIGVVLSWALLQVGFAYNYWAVDEAGQRGGVTFPGKRKPTLIDYFYFSFTIGASFATSDAQVLSLRVRRVVLLHSILSFFYNALVVAIAFQVLQQTIRT
ncbi:DUF1345 domain-containing protein [Microbacterium horticulturae]|uniref:DUF1345 domain-containing protein n=1 Tax=Microbacterium horticulturae TaxID=3028316 RepID=A0ABY8C0I6_9MICO|nr:DUF1345 domain-containing protein [Microbacterium sp. KACC 23027]WEG09242.1 DUF1345 domain-containing protein [Microbacterium sp. KACC 23027]